MLFEWMYAKFLDSWQPEFESSHCKQNSTMVQFLSAHPVQISAVMRD